MNTKTTKTSWLKAMAAAFAAAAMAGAHGAEKITVDEVANHYPWDGKVDCVTTLSGLGAAGAYKYEGVFTLSVRKDGAKVGKTVTNAFASADGTYTNTFDCTALFGAGRYPNGGIAVDLVKNLGGVQLWADGPYWAECNVGASRPEECGYYFMWGDTNAYVRNSSGDGWVSVKDGMSFEFGNGNCATHLKDNNALIEAGYIDSATSNLVAKYDAATVRFGGPWRMPTSDEIQALADNCTMEWITTNGVSGHLVTGKGAYVTKSIFLPAAGRGYGADLYNAGSVGRYWSSTPHSEEYSGQFFHLAWELYFDSGNSYRFRDDRGFGMCVRPLRTAAK